MRIIVIASFNKGRFAPFVVEQSESLKKVGCEVLFFGLKGKGVWGYLSNFSLLKRRIDEYKPDVIHAHYGLSGLLANMQRKVPVVTTYHGSDINDKKVWPFSRLAMRLSAWNIFVSQKTLEKAKPKSKYTLMPCGVDLTDLQLTERREARRKMHLDETKRIVLFSGAFDNQVKDAALAKQSVALLHDKDAELIELKGYSREQVTLLMCASDTLLMTSVSEGSPQVVKEAMACGCPVVSVDVGDVKERTNGLEGSFVSEKRDAVELASLLRKAFDFEGKTDGRQRLVLDGLENGQVATKIMRVYQKVCE